jgi:hypothetical protein
MMIMAQTQPPFNLLTILGPTASGKTCLAVALAQELSGEIISADSRQVFRQMDIGSGKDLHEYGEVPYHLIDIIDPGKSSAYLPFSVCLSRPLKRSLPEASCLSCAVEPACIWTLPCVVTAWWKCLRTAA